MQYPLISEYVEAIHSAEDNFDKLSNLRPVLDDNGNPVMSCGNFAVVFKMKDVITGRFFAVKCFIKDQERRSEHYKLIAEELNYVSSPYLLHVRYLERELFVNTAGSDEEEFPVLVMDWVKGKPLDVYLKRHINDTYELQMLAYRFCKLGAWLLSQPFAHGDLKPDNILVREDGTLVLVDYDGMYVPAMEGSEAIESGSPDFRHPLRDKKVFNEHNDDFSVASIALSLKSIALDSQLYHKYAAADRLLFSAVDYRDIGQSSALQAIVGLSSDAELSLLLGIFLLAWSKNSLESISFRLLLLTEPKKPVIEVLSTEITDEERKNAIKDEFGATYTADGLKLISVPWDVIVYKIKEDTKVIGNCAFSNRNTIFIENRLLKDRLFPDCIYLASIIIPNSVTSIGYRAFYGCRSLSSITIPDSVTSIGAEAFYGCESLPSIIIPDSVTSIGQSAMNRCYNLRHIFIKSSKYYIQGKLLLTREKEVVSCWSNDSQINLPQEVARIGAGAFYGCESLSSIVIPNSVTSIGDRAFFGCKTLTSITIPDSVKSIGDYAFLYCYSLASITIPDSVTSIGNCALSGCNSLQKIKISKGTRERMLNMLGTWCDDILVEI